MSGRLATGEFLIAQRKMWLETVGERVETARIANLFTNNDGRGDACRDGLRTIAYGYKARRAAERYVPSSRAGYTRAFDLFFM